MEDWIVIPILGIVFGCGIPVIVGSILGFQYIKGRNAERLAMITQGIIPQEYPKPLRKVNRYAALRNGLVLVGIGSGIFLGVFSAQGMVPRIWEEMFIASLAVILGGVGFVTYFFLARNMERKDDAYTQRQERV